MEEDEYAVSDCGSGSDADSHADSPREREAEDAERVICEEEG